MTDAMTDADERELREQMNAAPPAMRLAAERILQAFDRLGARALEMSVEVDTLRAQLASAEAERRQASDAYFDATVKLGLARDRERELYTTIGEQHREIEATKAALATAREQLRAANRVIAEERAHVEKRKADAERFKSDGKHATSAAYLGDALAAECAVENIAAALTAPAKETSRDE